MNRSQQRGDASINVIAGALVVLVLAWQVWKGVTLREIGLGPATFKFGQSEMPRTPIRIPTLEFTFRSEVDFLNLSMFLDQNRGAIVHLVTWFASDQVKISRGEGTELLLGKGTCTANKPCHFLRLELTGKDYRLHEERGQTLLDGYFIVASGVETHDTDFTVVLTGIERESVLLQTQQRSGS